MFRCWTTRIMNCLCCWAVLFTGGLRLANSDAIENFQQAGISLASPTMVVSLRNTTRQLASLAKLRLKGVR